MTTTEIKLNGATYFITRDETGAIVKVQRKLYSSTGEFLQTVARGTKRYAAAVAA